MQKIVASLEAIANSVDKGLDLSKTQEAIKTTRGLIKDFVDKTNGKSVGAIHELPLLKELDAELLIWQSKLSVILSEPVGKKGMAKHARHWVERLKMSSQ